MYLQCFLLLTALVASAHSETRVKRMINGRSANITDYPYLVYIGGTKIPCPNCIAYRCAGAILSKYYVLTAAHCLRDPIRAGSTFASEGGSVHYIDFVTLHENFSINVDPIATSRFDIAVIRVKEPFVYYTTIQPIAPARLDHRHISLNTSAKSAGWGKVKNTAKNVHGWLKTGYPERVRELDFHVVDTKACNESYVTWGGIFEGQFCAATDNQVQRSPWNGDSGSPLVIGREVVGITIWKGGLDLMSAPTVYTDVGYLRDWIDKHVEYDDNDDDKGCHC